MLRPRTVGLTPALARAARDLHHPGVRPPPRLWLLAALLPVACSRPEELQDASGRYRLLVSVAVDPALPFAGQRDLIAGALAAAPVDVLVAADHLLAGSAEDALAAASRRDVRIVCASVAPPDARRRATDGRWTAAVEYGAGCGGAGLDVAVLAARGIDVPRRIGLGARWFRAATAAAGGTEVPAPGDFALRTLRLQHDALLTTPGDAVLRIAYVDGGPDGHWCSAVRADLEAARPARPGIDLGIDAGGDGGIDAGIRRALAQNPSALLVASRDPGPHAEARREALARGVAVVVLGVEPADEHWTGWVGVDPHALGRAAADAVRQVAAEGARLAIVRRPSGPHADALQQGFVEALGLARRP